VAGPVQRERRGVQQPDHDIRAELEHGRPRDQHIVRGGDDRRRSYNLALAAVPAGLGQGRIRCCWLALTICGNAAWPWDARGATPPIRRRA